MSAGEIVSLAAEAGFSRAQVFRSRTLLAARSATLTPGLLHNLWCLVDDRQASPDEPGAYRFPRICRSHDTLGLATLILVTLRPHAAAAGETAISWRPKIGLDLPAHLARPRTPHLPGWPLPRWQMPHPRAFT